MASGRRSSVIWRRWWAVATVVVAAGGAAVACGSPPPDRALSPAISPDGRRLDQAKVGIAPDGSLPKGWVRYSYGALSIGAPVGWRVVHGPPSPCGGAFPDTVTVATLSKIEVTSCPSISGSGPAADAVAIVCLVGEAAQEGIGPLPVDGPGLMRDGNGVYERGSGFVAAALVPAIHGISAVDTQILATTKPTGIPCP